MLNHIVFLYCLYLIEIVLSFILYNNYHLNINKVVNWLLYLTICIWLVAGVLGMTVVYGFIQHLMAMPLVMLNILCITCSFIQCEVFV